MSDLISALVRATDELTRLAKAHALVGGLAVSARVEPRLTRDADLAVALTDDAEAERLLNELRSRGYEISALVEQEATGRLATARLVPRGDPDGLVTDLLFASSGIEHEIVSNADDLEIVPGLSLPVAAVGHLIALKLLARDDRRRPLDADDLRALSEIADDTDWALASTAVSQIIERGYHRDRDLARSLADLRRHGAY